MLQLWDYLSGDRVLTIRPTHPGVPEGTQIRFLGAQFDSNQVIAAYSHGVVKRWLLLSDA